jgi:AAA domain
MDGMMMNKTESMFKLNSLYIRSPEIKSIIDAIETTRIESAVSDYKFEPRAIVITGEEGAGKSTLIEQFLSQSENLQSHTSEYTKIPLLRISLLGITSSKQMMEHILRQFNIDEKLLSGNTQELLHTAVTLLRACKVELVFVDEAQSVVESANKNVNHDVTDNIKRLMIESKVPFIFFGLPWLKGAFQANQQLCRRCAYYQLKDYSLDTYEDFLIFLTLFGKKIPLQNNVQFTQLEMSFRLFAASMGRVGFLTENILKSACKKAIMSGSESLERSHIENAVDVHMNGREAYAAIPHPFKAPLDKVVANFRDKFSKFDPSKSEKQGRIQYAGTRSFSYADLLEHHRGLLR